jgi:hypothetical protein
VDGVCQVVAQEGGGRISGSGSLLEVLRTYYQTSSMYIGKIWRNTECQQLDVIDMFERSASSSESRRISPIKGLSRIDSGLGTL